MLVKLLHPSFRGRQLLPVTLPCRLIEISIPIRPYPPQLQYLLGQFCHALLRPRHLVPLLCQRHVQPLHSPLGLRPLRGNTHHLGRRLFRLRPLVLCLGFPRRRSCGQAFVVLPRGAGRDAGLRDLDRELNGLTYRYWWCWWCLCYVGLGGLHPL